MPDPQSHTCLGVMHVCALQVGCMCHTHTALHLECTHMHDRWKQRKNVSVHARTCCIHVQCNALTSGVSARMCPSVSTMTCCIYVQCNALASGSSAPMCLSISTMTCCIHVQCAREWKQRSNVPVCIHNDMLHPCASHPIISTIITELSTEIITTHSCL